MKVASLRGIGAALFAAGVWLALTGCREARDPALERGATVVMAVPDASVMKPDAWNLDFLTFLPLATLDEHGELKGRLARSWEHSADFKEWTYHLRTDVRWDDGKPITSRDVKFTLELLEKAGTGYSGINATIVDDSTVRIRAAKPLPRRCVARISTALAETISYIPDSAYRIAPCRSGCKSRRPMKEGYLEVTYRHGKPLAAYFYLPRQARQKSVRTRRVEPGLIIDLTADGQPLGIEITAPAQVTLTILNRVLRGLGCAPVRRADLAPLRAA